MKKEKKIEKIAARIQNIMITERFGVDWRAEWWRVRPSELDSAKTFCFFRGLSHEEQEVIIGRVSKAGKVSARLIKELLERHQGERENSPPIDQCSLPEWMVSDENVGSHSDLVRRVLFLAVEEGLPPEVYLMSRSAMVLRWSVEPHPISNHLASVLEGLSEEEARVRIHIFLHQHIGSSKKEFMIEPLPSSWDKVLDLMSDDSFKSALNLYMANAEPNTVARLERHGFSCPEERHSLHFRGRWGFLFHQNRQLPRPPQLFNADSPITIDSLGYAEQRSGIFSIPSWASRESVWSVEQDVLYKRLTHLVVTEGATVMLPFDDKGGFLDLDGVLRPILFHTRTMRRILAFGESACDMVRQVMDRVDRPDIASDLVATLKIVPSWSLLPRVDSWSYPPDTKWLSKNQNSSRYKELQGEANLYPEAIMKTLIDCYLYLWREEGFRYFNFRYLAAMRTVGRLRSYETIICFIEYLHDASDEDTRAALSFYLIRNESSSLEGHLKYDVDPSEVLKEAINKLKSNPWRFKYVPDVTRERMTLKGIVPPEFWITQE